MTITNTATGLTRATTTDGGGRYVFTAMPTEGRYRLHVELAGFATAVREDIVFNAGQRALINFSLRLSTVQETITVAGDTPIVQTTSSEVSRNPDGQGFAAFGRVVSGMDVVRKIQAAPSSTTRTSNAEAQRLTPPIKILKVARVP